MDQPVGRRGSAGIAKQLATLVWMDSREALVVRWDGVAARVDRIESEVPAHHRSTGHVRHDPMVRHGGGGPVQSAGDPHRLEHLARFVDAVAERLPVDGDLFVIGPGTVHEKLARHVHESDAHQKIARQIRCERSARATRRQLIARLREAVGANPQRGTVGAYRWTWIPARGSRERRPGPVRVVEKPPSSPPDEGWGQE